MLLWHYQATTAEYSIHRVDGAGPVGRRLRAVAEHLTAPCRVSSLLLRLALSFITVDVGLSGCEGAHTWGRRGSDPMLTRPLVTEELCSGAETCEMQVVTGKHLASEFTRELHLPCRLRLNRESC